MSEPFVPEGAPRRAFGAQLSVVVFVGLTFAALVVLAPHPIFTAVGIVGVSLLMALGVSFWRRTDRTSWYERREIVVPALPFKMRTMSWNVEFEAEGVRFSGLLRRERFITYDDIRRVDTLCRGITLEGVMIRLTDRDYHGIDDVPEQIEEGASNGETTRIALAILRQQAPHARFTGPQWIEEGWVPRLGFVLRQRGMPG